MSCLRSQSRVASAAAANGIPRPASGVANQAGRQRKKKQNYETDACKISLAEWCEREHDVRFMDGKYYYFQSDGTRFYWPGETRQEVLSKFHEYSVREAVSKNKMVPGAVLAEHMPGYVQGSMIDLYRESSPVDGADRTIIKVKNSAIPGVNNFLLLREEELDELYRLIRKMRRTYRPTRKGNNGNE